MCLYSFCYLITSVRQTKQLHQTKTAFLKQFGWFISEYIQKCLYCFYFENSHSLSHFFLFLLIFNVLFKLKMKSLKVPKPNDPILGCNKSWWIKYEPQGEQIILFLCVSLTHILTQKPVHQLFSFISISNHKNLAVIHQTFCILGVFDLLKVLLFFEAVN